MKKTRLKKLLKKLIRINSHKELKLKLVMMDQLISLIQMDLRKLSRVVIWL